MVEIIKIEKTKKGFYALFSKEGFLFSVDDETLVSKGIKIGSLFDESQISDIMETREWRACFGSALNYLSFKSQSAKTLYDKLTKKYSKEVCAEVISKLIEERLLDDSEYAKNLCEYYVQKGFGKKRIENELYKKGISREISKEVLADIVLDERSAIRELVERKYKAKLCEKNGRAKVFAALARAGYSYSEINSVLMENFDD